ncbi:MAG: glycoside hydrolase family 88 protein [Muribaculum sp.]|nr:glycoside hydrolase family 88 protein [Muribaculaceae bacterium]MCM1080401.1 glycoside hydrolase family 88 protein [Muribaculum sp.]
MKYISIAASMVAALTTIGCTNTEKASEAEVNDSTSPLHLLQPEYTMPYGQLKADSIRATIDRVFNYIAEVTPAKVVDSLGNEITDLTSPLPEGAKLNQGTYRLTSYEWGVMYDALLEASRLLGDSKYQDYVVDRVSFLSRMAPAFTELAQRTGQPDGQMRQVTAPRNLDDAGAMCGAFMRTQMAEPTLKLQPEIERYWQICETVPIHLSDGTIARNRPYLNSVWLDDMFMGLPTMAVRSVYEKNPKLLDQATSIAEGFIKRMWVPEKGFFRHGYVEGVEPEPTFPWARANGWAILTMSQLLDFMPEDHPKRQLILDTFRNHAKTLVSLQSKNGFWHQLLDRNDTFEESSATAIFTYCLAHGINQGWLDPRAFGPAAQLGWEALTTKITPTGEIEDIVVGTGMGFDPAFYAFRRVSTKAAHGYGPAIWAGAEMVKLIESSYPYLNDSAILFYDIDPEASTPIFSLNENQKAENVLH